MAIVILASAALAVGACNNGSGTNSGGGTSAAPTMATSSEPSMSLESPLASDMPSVDASTAP